MNRHYIWSHSRKMSPKFTCRCRVEISIWNKHVFCSDVYTSAPNRNLPSKHFLVHGFNKRKTKNAPWFFKGTEVSAITLHAFWFYFAGSNVYFCVNRKSRVWLECKFFGQVFSSIEMCFLYQECWLQREFVLLLLNNTILYLTFRFTSKLWKKVAYVSEKSIHWELNTISSHKKCMGANDECKEILIIKKIYINRIITHLLISFQIKELYFDFFQF